MSVSKTKEINGSYHTPEILPNTWKVGVSTNLSLAYSKGSSKWKKQSILIHSDGGKEMVTTPISSSLVSKQKLTPKDVAKVKSIHVKLQTVFAMMEVAENPTILKRLGKEVIKLDFELQKAWKFKRDARMHTWWFRSPKCECPKLDNWDAVGTSRQIIALSCPVHT